MYTCITVRRLRLGEGGRARTVLYHVVRGNGDVPQVDIPLA